MLSTARGHGKTKPPGVHALLIPLFVLARHESICQHTNHTRGSIRFVEPLRGSYLGKIPDPPVGATRQTGATNIEALTGFVVSLLCVHHGSLPGLGFTPVFYHSVYDGNRKHRYYILQTGSYHRNGRRGRLFLNYGLFLQNNRSHKPQLL